MRQYGLLRACLFVVLQPRDHGPYRRLWILVEVGAHFGAGRAINSA